MFSIATTDFLADLSLSNTRAFFEANKSRYERDVREPALAFIRALEPTIAELSPHYLAIASKSGGSLMRVYRDTRFASDKTPYKTNVGIQFRHERGRDVHAPGFYVHLESQSAFVAAGAWHPDSETLSAIRRRIADDPESWLAARDDSRFRAVYRIGGESLKTSPKGFAKDHPMIEDLRRKDHIASVDLRPDEIFGAEGVERVADLLHRASPYMRFLAESAGLPY